MRRIVIVGEAPSQFSDPALPFKGASGKTLAALAGLSGYEELAREAALVNVLKRWPGAGHKGEKGSKFPIPRARRAAKRMKFDDGALVLLCGKRVAEAFGMKFTDYFSWKIAMRGKLGGVVWFVCFPHPSGCNRWFNYPENRDRARHFLRTYVFDRISTRAA